MPELHWTEVDHVTVVWADVAGPLRAGLLFRTGQADETLITSGHTHLIEHMALAAMSDAMDRHNGIVDGVTTGFFTVGQPREVSAFLANVCDALTSLPRGRLESEKQLLAAEKAGRPHDFCSHLMVWRYGAAGHGLLGMPELGLRRATVEQLQAYAAQRFTSENAVLWLTGPPPDDLCFRLPRGKKLHLPRLAPIQESFPGWFLDNACGGVAAGGTVSRRCASTMFGDIALARLRKRLRSEQAVSYAPSVMYFPLDADVAHLVLYADSDADRRAELSQAFGEVVTQLTEIDESEVEAARTRVREHWSGPLAPSDADRMAAEVQRAAVDWIFGKAFQPWDSLAAEFASVTKSDVLAVARELQSTAMFALPGDVKLEAWCGTQAPMSTVPVVQGREIPSIDAPIRQECLVSGPDGVSLIFPDGSHCTVRYAQLAAALHYGDGCVALVGSDAAGVTVEPTLWRDGQDVCRRICGRIPAQLLIDYPSRAANDIPKPTTTARQRFFARLGLGG
jgi:zinc protease